MEEGRDNIIVYRLGSMGDFIMALPCLHLIRKVFQDSRVILLSNQPTNPLAVTPADLLQGAGLVDEFRHHPEVKTADSILNLRRTISAIGPKMLIYMAARKSLFPVVRDYMFFRGCGIKHIVGLPFTADGRHCRLKVSDMQLWESEAERVARLLRPIGDVDCKLAENWDLRLTAEEKRLGDVLLRDLLPLVKPTGEVTGQHMIAMSVGTKQSVKDWGNDNWRAVLKKISPIGRPLVFIGAEADKPRSELLASEWPHGHLNLCGRTSPRISAAVLRRAAFFMGHDSGPMHLAAAVGTRCVGLFSGAKNKPGEWYPFGEEHEILHAREEESVMSIKLSDVIAAVTRVAVRAGITGKVL